MLLDLPPDMTQYDKLTATIVFTNGETIVFKGGEIKEMWNNDILLTIRATNGRTHHFPLRNIMEWAVDKLG